METSPEKKPRLYRIYIETGIFLALLASAATIYQCYRDDKKMQQNIIHDTITIDRSIRKDPIIDQSSRNKVDTAFQKKQSLPPTKPYPLKQNESNKTAEKEVVNRDPTKLIMVGSVHLDQANLDGGAHITILKTTSGDWKMIGYFNGRVRGNVEMTGTGMIADNKANQTINFSGKVSDGTRVARCSSKMTIDTQINIAEGDFEREGVPDDKPSSGLPESGNFKLDITQKTN